MLSSEAATKLNEIAERLDGLANGIKFLAEELNRRPGPSPATGPELTGDELDARRNDWPQ